MYLEKPLLECRYNHMLIICSFLRSLLPLLIPVVFFFFFFFRWAYMVERRFAPQLSRRLCMDIIRTS